MPEKIPERLLADASYEEHAFGLFPLTISPEEYAAREAAGWMCFSFASYRFRNQQLDAWIQSLGHILSTPGLVEHCQEQFLNPEEIVEQRRRASEEW